MQLAVDEASSVHTSPFPVVFPEESKLVRTPGPAHPYMIVPSEVRESGSASSPDSSRASFTFPSIAIYCHLSSPTASTPPYPCSHSPIQYSPHCQSPSESPQPTVSNVEEAVAPVKQPVCARLSVPTDGTQRLRSAGGSLSRSQSHPLHRQRRRSRPSVSDVDTLSAHHQQTQRLKNFAERTS